MAILAQWNMEQEAASTVAAGISASKLANTQGLPTYGLMSPGYATDPVLRAGAQEEAINQATALSTGSYWQITITPTVGSIMSLSRLSVLWGRGATTARYGFIRGSHDGFTADLWPFVQVAGLLPDFDVNSPDIDLSGIAALQDTDQPVSFRFYCAASTTGRPIDWDNLTIEGTVAAAPTEGIARYRVPMTLEVEHVLGAPTTARADYVATPASWPASLGSLYAVVIDSRIVATGVVDSMTRSLAAPASTEAKYQLELVGPEGVLQRRLFWADYARDVSVADIISDLDSQILTGEDIDVGTIDSGTTTLFYPQFKWVPAQVVLDELASAIGGYWYIDPWPWALHLRTWGAVSVPWALSLKAPVYNVRVVERRGEYANVVYATNSTATQYAVNATEIAARAAAEGGTGRYERILTADADFDATDVQEFADEVLARSDEWAFEITYHTPTSGLAVGMTQLVDLPELDVPTNTYIRLERIVTREVAPRVFHYEVTGRTHDLGSTWERQWDKALMKGTYGAPRYWRP